MSEIRYKSTQGGKERFTLEQVLFDSQPSNGGLYVPDRIPLITPENIAQFRDLSYPEVSYRVLLPYLENTGIDVELFRQRLEERFTFEPKIITLEKDLFLLDLNQGPTSAFKDFGANTLAALMDTILMMRGRRKTVIVATTGDTGPAAGNALKDYADNPNINVVILFPKGKISEDQRKLMTTIGGNVQCLEVDGDFDVCQAMVKDALKNLDGLTSANSINWGRIMGQSVYPFFIASRLPNKNPPIYIVPSGNLGNATGVLYGKEMGLPVEKIVLSHNSNGNTEHFALQGRLNYKDKSQKTLSSAMDVAVASNLFRIIPFYGGSLDQNGRIIKDIDLDDFQRDFFATTSTDSETEAMMREFYEIYGQQIDPHTAVGFLGLEKIYKEHPEYRNPIIPKIVYSTAHESKFPVECTRIYGEEPIPTQPIIDARAKEESYTPIEGRYQALKEFLMDSGLATMRS
jgi:threonine synthase